MPSNIRTSIVIDRLPELRDQLRTQASRIVRKTAFDVEAGAKSRVPVVTGNLKNSIQTTIENDVTAIVGTAVEYASYVEFGIRRRAPKPYLGPAAEAVRPAFIAAMKQVFA